MTSEADLLIALRRFWGYSSFRPLQERIVNSIVAGHDTCVVMPTGGGKSLCYQLPAVILGQTGVVISPLIALMQDQAAQLAQMGIAAAVLNSTVSHEEQNRVIREARAGAYRLLYLSPERLQRADTLAWIRQVPISFFAIDEAHCISEWGHEFRPEYRQLSRLRSAFPEKPIAAFTASATHQVRHDILAQLALRNPDKYIASFHRPNLSYLVRECDAGEHSRLLVTALQNSAQGNVIVYSPTINKVEETVDFLAEQGIAAVPYHARMPSEQRRTNQERWMSDEVRVLVGTIAFGLGINKATVRAVIHLSLPKSLEQFYQEAGRAGRDGNPADCILLWQKRDAGLLGHFANQISDPAEKERAWQRYHVIRNFAESKKCRHRQICLHFGETPKWTSCEACDVCGVSPGWMTVAESRSAVRRVFSRGAGIAKQLPPALTESESELADYLREWRRAIAREQGTPAFVVLHDTTIEEICRVQPASLEGLLGITGIGERKAALYGQEILAVMQRFRTGARASVANEKKLAPMLETAQLLADGKTFDEIAAIRGRQTATVVNAAASLVERGEVAFSNAWIDRNRMSVIEAACKRVGVAKLDRLKILKDVLPPEINYDEIRLVVAHLRWQEKSSALSSSGKNS